MRRTSAAADSAADARLADHALRPSPNAAKDGTKPNANRLTDNHQGFVSRHAMADVAQVAAR